jgi:hypothetical protein
MIRRHLGHVRLSRCDASLRRFLPLLVDSLHPHLTVDTQMPSRPRRLGGFAASVTIDCLLGVSLTWPTRPPEPHGDVI